jgi:hypothetical protein
LLLFYGLTLPAACHLRILPWETGPVASKQLLYGTPTFNVNQASLTMSASSALGARQPLPSG